MSRKQKANKAKVAKPPAVEDENDAQKMHEYEVAMAAWAKAKKDARRLDEAQAVRDKWPTVMALVAHFVAVVYDEKLTIPVNEDNNGDDDGTTWDTKNFPVPHAIPPAKVTARYLEVKAGIDHDVVVSYVYMVLLTLGCVTPGMYAIEKTTDGLRAFYYSLGEEILTWQKVTFDDDLFADAAECGAAEVPIQPQRITVKDPKGKKQSKEREETVNEAHMRCHTEYKTTTLRFKKSHKEFLFENHGFYGAAQAPLRSADEELAEVEAYEIGELAQGKTAKRKSVAKGGGGGAAASAKKGKKSTGGGS